MAVVERLSLKKLHKQEASHIVDSFSRIIKKLYLKLKNKKQIAQLPHLRHARKIRRQYVD
jgi:hypothetical protein